MMILSIRIKNILIEIIKMLFMILFVYTATSKLLDFKDFKIQLQNAPYVSDYADSMAWGLPILEYMIAGMFLFPKYMVYALYSSLFLMTLFTTYIYTILNFSKNIPCSCGGVLSTMGWNAHFIFNIAFMALAVIGIILVHKQDLP